MEIAERKKIFLDTLRERLGIIAASCKACSISRQTFYNWKKADEVFRREVEDITEEQLDYVEDRLLKLVAIGDTTATIFYLKTKGKKRGWSEVYQPREEEQAALPYFPVEECAEEIRRRMRDGGRYDAMYEPLIGIAAYYYQQVKILGEQLRVEGFSYKIYTRDGNVRAEANPKAETIRRFGVLLIETLTKLGLSPDSKLRQEGEDGLDKFLDALRDDGGAETGGA